MESLLAEGKSKVMDKPRYPTDERGIPVVPDNTACYELCLKGINNKDRHHLSFDRREHRSALERQYRNCSSMIVSMCMCAHEDLHSAYSGPGLPSNAVMRDVVSRRIGPQTASEAGVELRISTKAQVNEVNTYGNPRLS